MASKERIAAMAKEIFGDAKPAQSDAPSAEEFWKTWWPEQITKRCELQARI